MARLIPLSFDPRAIARSIVGAGIVVSVLLVGELVVWVDELADELGVRFSGRSRGRIA